MCALGVRVMSTAKIEWQIKWNGFVNLIRLPGALPLSYAFLAYTCNWFDFGCISKEFHFLYALTNAFASIVCADISVQSIRTLCFYDKKKVFVWIVICFAGAGKLEMVAKIKRIRAFRPLFSPRNLSKNVRSMARELHSN